MNKFTLAATVILSLAATVLSQSCANTCVRREVRALSQDERTRYFNALRSLMRNGRYDRFTANHIEFARQAHNNPHFLPWHRAMLHTLERELQAVDPGVCLHYWSWDIDSQAPHSSPVFSAGFYYGRGGADGCLNEEFLGGWRPQNPSPGSCVRRAWDQNVRISAWTGPEVLNRIISSTLDDFASFTEQLEGTPHGSVHVNIGGSMNSMASPNDPIFYAHHAFVDRLWHLWQGAGGGNRFSGTHWSGSRQVATSDRMDPWPFTVADVQNIASLCYSYEDFDASRANINRLPASVSGASESKPKTTSPPEPPKEIAAAGKPHVTARPLAEKDAARTAATDPYNLIQLRRPQPLNVEWIIMNGMKLDTVRAYEAKYNEIVDKLNDVYGYVSPASLYNRYDLVAYQVKHKEVSKYIVPVKNYGEVDFGYNDTLASTDPYQVVAELLDVVDQVVPYVDTDPQVLKEAILPITGEPVMGKNDASNFMKSTDRDSGADRHTISTMLFGMLAVVMAQLML